MKVLKNFWKKIRFQCFSVRKNFIGSKSNLRVVFFS